MYGTTINLKSGERTIVRQAIVEYLPSLNYGEVGQYKMAASHLSKKEIFVDGIIMRCFENSLRFKADKDGNLAYLRLAESIKQQRESFQLQAMSRLGLVAI